MGLILCKPRPSSLWPDLPPELLGLILCRLLSHADRLSFMAVCRQWRLAGQQQHPLPPPLPWLCVDDRVFYNLPGGEPRRFKQAPRHIECFDNWIFLFERDDDDDGGSDTRFLINPSSRKKIRLPELRFCYGSAWPRKMIVCSPGLVVASSYDSHEVAFYRPGVDVSWSVYPSTSSRLDRYEDIAFHHGKLYILTVQEHLLQQGLSGASNAQHVIRRRPPPNKNHDQYEEVNDSIYLVSSSYKLLMVRISCFEHYREQGSTSTRFVVDKVVFEVFEADLVMGRWLEMKALDRGQALFVGRGGSKVILLAGHDEIFKWNRVYFTGPELGLCLPKADTSYAFYDLSNHRIGQVFNKSRGFFRSQWFFHCA